MMPTHTLPKHRNVNARIFQREFLQRLETKKYGTRVFTFFLSFHMTGLNEKFDPVALQSLQAVTF